MLRYPVAILSLLMIILAASCSAPKNTVYFKDDNPANPAVVVQPVDSQKEAIIQPDDILAINITSPSIVSEKNPMGIYNEGGTPFSSAPTIGNGYTQGQSSGYLVDKTGFIDFPVLGKIQAAGLSIRELKQQLVAKLSLSIREPVVEVRITNYKITVMGEVPKPGVVLAPNHKINVLEALATAGDIPITGRKDNVLVIREQGGVREFARLNLNSKNVFSNPYYNLKQNDIVYVEASAVRRQENNQFVRIYLPIITSVVSLALTAIAVSRIR